MQDDPKPFDYIAEANITASNNYHGYAVSHHEAVGIIRSAIFALTKLDELKKALFYGRNLEGFGNGGVALSMASWPERILPENYKHGELLAHSIIGTATEAGELLELLLATVDGGKAFDMVNFAEEVGDGFWYAAIGLPIAGETFDSVQRRNIAKLRRRFPNAFNEYDANNRDLLAERRILEAGAGTPEGYRSPMTDGEGHVIECTSPNGFVKLAPGEEPEAKPLATSAPIY